MLNNKFCPHMFSNHYFGRLRSLLFHSLAHQAFRIFYINYSIWHHIFVFFATFWDDEKCCRNCVDPGTKRAQTAKIVYAGQKRVRLEKEYLHSDWNSYTNILMAGGEGGYLFSHKSFFTKLRTLPPLDFQKTPLGTKSCKAHRLSDQNNFWIEYISNFFHMDEFFF